MKKPSYRYRFLITIILAAVLILDSGLICAEADSEAGLEEYIAMGIVAGEGSASPYDTSENETEPILEAGPRSFAEALAQEYTPQNEEFILSEESRFYITSEEAPGKEILDTVSLMDSQFAAYALPSERPLPVVYGPAGLEQRGDIVINLVDEDDFLYGIHTADLNQTYRLDIGETAAVEAVSTDGIWYGLIELMEMAQERQTADDEESGAKKTAVIIDGCRIKDGPDLKERALMLDCGRKYFSREWIENLIRRASLQRYNAIILHFAEAEGVRIDSEVFPWLTEDIESLSTEDVKAIVETAHMYHIDVIPSFDTPGHNTFMVRKYSSYVKKNADFTFEYDGRTYDKSVKGFSSIANHYSYGGSTDSADYIGIDLTKEHAVAFTNALIEGYADFFGRLGCTRFDIGSDELLGWYTFELGGETFTYDNRWKALDHWKKYARETLGIKKGSARDVLISYINDLSERLENMGYTCRVFNDEIDAGGNQHVDLRESVEVTYWFDADNTADHYADKGHVMHNFMESWCFYVLRTENGRDIMTKKYKTVNARNIFENWNPRSFGRRKGDEMTVPEDKLGGGYFAIWCDYPDYKDAAAVWKETELKTWANASRMWNPEVNSDSSGILSSIAYSDMRTFALRMNGFPGYTGDCGAAPVIPDSSDLTEGAEWWQKILKSAGTD